jgi:hypothetical protein
MSDQAASVPVRADPPAPPWLLARFLQPGENVVWSRGPEVGPWAEWALKRYPGLGFVLVLGGLVFPLTGIAIAWLCGAERGVAGLLCAVLPLVAMVAAADSWKTAERHVCHALTDRRLLIITGLNKVEQFAVGPLRRLLATTDARSAEGAAVPRILDVSKGRPRAARPAAGVTEVGPILRLLRAFGQLQGAAKG